jgi:hypothetical protein
VHPPIVFPRAAEAVLETIPEALLVLRLEVRTFTVSQTEADAICSTFSVARFLYAFNLESDHLSISSGTIVMATRAIFKQFRAHRTCSFTFRLWRIPGFEHQRRLA